MANETRSHPTKGLDLDASTTILYKFFVRDRSLVPIGLREGQGRSDYMADHQHAEAAREAGQKGLAQVDRVRLGRVDTGLPVYQHEQRVHIGSVRSLLAREGYWLADAYFFKKPAKNGKPGDVVIVLALSDKVEFAMKLPRTTMGALRKLARENVWTVHVWDNSNIGNPSTVNFTSRQQGKPTSMLLVRDGFLRLATPEGKDASEVEENEDKWFAQAVLDALEEL